MMNGDCVHRSGRRQSKWLILLMAASLSGAGCAEKSGGETGGSADRPVALELTNSGAEALQCSIVFGHWVYRELDILAPGETRDIAVTQAARDGALYIERYDGARQMMIENLTCDRTVNRHDSRGLLDLSPARSTRIDLIAAQCAAPEGAGRVICRIAAMSP
jgi:hypothetical protein